MDTRNIPLIRPKSSMKNSSIHVNTSVNIIPVEVLTPVLAPSTLYKDVLFDLLKSKYGEKTAKHLDRVFERSPLLKYVAPQYSDYVVYISGSAVLTALKRSAGVALCDIDYPQGFAMYGMFFREQDTVVNEYHIVTKQNKPTLLVTELIRPGARGILVYTGEIPQQLKVDITQIGYRKRRGFGLVKIHWDKNPMTGGTPPEELLNLDY